MWPMVMRLGMACGLTMRSGTMPSWEKGMSSIVYVMPTVPFWPWRLANLSPTCAAEQQATLVKAWVRSNSGADEHILAHNGQKLTQY